MTRPIPSADVLLRAAGRYLEHELMPTLDGYHRFQTRVTVNVLRILERELRLGGVQAHDERARLAALLGHDGDVDALNLELATGLRDGSVPLDTPGLADHLRATLHDGLAINNPKWTAQVPPTNTP